MPQRDDTSVHKVFFVSLPSCPCRTSLSFGLHKTVCLQYYQDSHISWKNVLSHTLLHKSGIIYLSTSETLNHLRELLKHTCILTILLKLSIFHCIVLFTLLCLYIPFVIFLVFSALRSWLWQYFISTLYVSMYVNIQNFQVFGKKMVNHFWESVDAILEDVSVTKTTVPC